MQSARDEIRDLERVRYVTENYEQLQGLKKIPVGLLMLFSGVLTLLPSNLSSVPFVIGGHFYLMLIVLIALVLLYFATEKYYERRFGWVHTFSLERKQIAAAGVLIFVLVAVGSVNLAFQPPIQMVWLAVGISLTAMHWRERRFRRHYVVFGLLICGASFLPLLGITQAGSAAYETGGIMCLVGLHFVIGGFLDHLLLVRTMKTLPEDDDG